MTSGAMFNHFHTNYGTQSSYCDQTESDLNYTELNLLTSFMISLVPE